MNEKQIERIIQTVANNNGVPVDTVVKEIELVIEEGMKSCDPLIQARWMLIPRKGDRPSAYEVVAYLSALVESKI